MEVEGLLPLRVVAQAIYLFLFFKPFSAHEASLLKPAC